MGVRQVTITCGPACARKSALEGLPRHLVAGVTRTLTVYARDASGCPTEGRDPVNIAVDSVSEGVRALHIQARTPTHAETSEVSHCQVHNLRCHSDQFLPLCVSHQSLVWAAELGLERTSMYARARHDVGSLVLHRTVATARTQRR